MSFYLDYAAHVGNDIAHTSSTARTTLGIGAGVIAAAITLVITEGGASVVIFAAVTQAARIGSAAADVGSVIDSFSPMSSEGKIIAGFDEVLLGPEIKPAARASAPETKLSCHSDMIAEGSKTVVIGSDFKPMVRRQDRTGCGGIVSTGLVSLMVGGEPSALGERIQEKDSDLVRFMNLVFGLGSVSRAISRGQAAGAVLKGAGAVADFEGDKKAAAALKGAAAFTSIPGNSFDAAVAARNAQKGGAALIDMTSGH